MFDEERKDFIWSFYIKTLIVMAFISFLVMGYVLLTSNIF